MHPTDAGFEHGHVSGKSSISLQRLQGSHAEPVVAFEEIADTRDKEAQCSASECRELRLVGYAEPDLEPAGTCGADRIAIQSWPSAQARAVANVVNTSWSMRANPGETSEHPSAHDRSMERTDRRDGMQLILDLGDDDTSLVQIKYHGLSICNRMTLWYRSPVWLYCIKIRLSRSLERGRVRALRSAFRLLLGSEEVPHFPAGRVGSRQEVIHFQQGADCGIGRDLFENPLLEQPDQPMQGLAMQCINRLQGVEHAISKVGFLQVLEILDHRCDLSQKVNPFFVSAIADERLW